MIDTSDSSRGDAARARLLDAAVNAFSEKGFHGTTTRDIASGAGMSPAALYVHHRSKEEMLYLIARDGHTETLAIVHEAVAKADGSTDTLRRAVHDFAAQHARRHTVARIISYELAALAPDHAAEISALRRDIQVAMRRVIAAGAETGEFDIVDVDATTAAILSMCIDLARWYAEGGRWTPDQIGDRYADLALRMVGADRRPAAQG